MATFDRVYKFALAVFVALSFVTTLLLMNQTADASMWTGRAPNHGYFDNKPNGGNQDLCGVQTSKGPVIESNCYADGPAIPISVTTPTEVYNWLYNKYTNPGTYGNPQWDKTGISFIVNTMLGRDPGTGHRDLVAADWSALKSALNDPDLTIQQQLVQSGTYGTNSYYQLGQDDAASSNDDELNTALIFIQNGTVVYVMHITCANPLGDLPGLTQSNQWNVTTGTTATKASPKPVTPALGNNEVIPGDTITWNHTIRNNGPDATDQDVSWHYNTTGATPAQGPAQTWTAGKDNGANNSFTSTYTVKPDDAGKTICRTTWASPQSSTNGSPTESAPVCFSVVYRYTLEPHASVDGGTSKTVEPGETATIDEWTNNSGPTTSKPTSYAVVKCTYAPGVAASTYAVQAPNSTNPQPGTGTCVNLFSTAQNGDTYVFPVGNNLFYGSFDETVPLTAAAGTHICYIKSLSPPDATTAAGVWVHSVPACLSVTKALKIQVLGGDVRADTIKTTVPKRSDGSFFGSWAEYGIFGIGGVTGMASGASLADGGSTNAPATLNALTFANDGTTGNFYSNTPNDDYFNVYNGMDGVAAGPTASGLIGNNTREIRKIDGDLRITADLVYSRNYGDISQIPRVIYVVSGNIYVDAGVTQIDPWLIASGTLYTCSDYTGATGTFLTISKCDKQLRFNGPVYVDKAVLGRTFSGAAGAGNTNDPAEIFNLAPSNFLSNYSTGISSTNIQTVYEKELPPRW